MDITRNWRLKTSRSQLLATRCPATGDLLLPGTGAANSTAERYTFETVEQPVAYAAETDYAKAAR
ncbi:MAG: hypothetical protein GYB65_23085 [Chloroflexi bacterium]|nr:hypothetical protein [Chloroflexota bacterium]